MRVGRTSTSKGMTWQGHVAHSARSSDVLNVIVYTVLDNSGQVRFTQWTKTPLSSPFVLGSELRHALPLAIKFPFFILHPSARHELQCIVKQPERRPEVDPTAALILEHHVEPACSSQYKRNDKCWQAHSRTHDAG